MNEVLLKLLLCYVLQRECGGESTEGQVAVASVIWNRACDVQALRGGKPQDYIELVLKKPKQFSSLNNIKEFNKDVLDIKINVFIKSLANSLIHGDFIPLGPWRHYYNPNLCSPIWAQYLTDIKKIGRHIFGK